MKDVSETVGNQVIIRTKRIFKYVGCFISCNFIGKCIRLAVKGVVRGGEGTIRADEGIIRAGQDV